MMMEREKESGFASHPSTGKQNSNWPEFVPLESQ